MSIGMIEKAPDDVLDYDVDFTMWLPAGDTVTDAEATVADSTAAVDNVDVSEKRVKIWLSGGADGDAGTLTLIATTAEGRTKQVCFRIRVKGC